MEKQGVVNEATPDSPPVGEKRAEGSDAHVASKAVEAVAAQTEANCAKPENC